MCIRDSVNVYHRGRKISIAQHWDSPSSRHENDNDLGDVAAMQEVGIIPDDGDWGSMHIEKYSASLDHLIDVLKGIRNEIESKTHNESSGKGNARATQIATGSAT